MIWTSDLRLSRSSALGWPLEFEVIPLCQGDLPSCEGGDGAHDISRARKAQER